MISKKPYLLNCGYGFFVSTANPVQFQDGTTYGSTNIYYTINCVVRLLKKLS